MSDPVEVAFEAWNLLDLESRHIVESCDWNTLKFDSDNLIEDDMDDMFSLTASLEDEIRPTEMETLQEDWRLQELEEQKNYIMNDDHMWGGIYNDLHPENMLVSMELVTPGRSLLRREVSPARLDTSPTTRSKSAHSKSARPDTPPSMDGEEHFQFRHAVDVAGAALRMLRDSASVANDHSYTSARQHIDSLGVQTPSDSGESEEEIDVVSIGSTKQLLSATTQLRPEPVQRRPAVQQRRRNQRKNEVAAARSQVGRKRLVPPSGIPAASVPRRRRGPGRRPRANMDTDSDAECPEIERRSIHNNMERQRRIGLKNLFDELKDQIPATRERERVAKVVILREAAAFCRQLKEEDQEKERLLKAQNKLMIQLKKLRIAHSQLYRR